MNPMQKLSLTKSEQDSLVFLKDPTKMHLIEKLLGRNKVSIIPHIVFVILRFYFTIKYSVVTTSQVFLRDCV